MEREWGAAEACRCTALLLRLGEAQAELSEVQQWRFSAVQVGPLAQRESAAFQLMAKS